MSNLPSEPPEAKHHPLNQDLDPECRDEIQACTAIEIGESRISARGLLAALSRLRISITEITFTGNSSQDGGGHADVAVATFIKKHGSSQREPKKVAVKKLRLSLSGDMTEEKFLRVFVNELRILDKLSHPNIMEIIGFVEDIENRIAWLVFPWEANGNLREFLRSERWHIPERVSLIRDVAFGLEYLHTHQPPICHGDLKSLNILVNSSNRAVITDFGSARFLQAEGGSGLRADPVTLAAKLPASTASNGDAPGQDEGSHFNVTVTDTTFTLTGPACSFRWAAPEVLNGEAPDLASDIWALGWIAWEAITDCYPFHELDREWVVTMRIIEGQLPAIYGHDQLSQIRRLCSMMLRCWKSEPKERPSAAECRKILKWIPSGIPVTNILGKSDIQVPSGLLQIGVLFQSYGRNEEASKMFEQGLAIARSNGDKETIGHILLGLAGIHRARSNYAEAEESYTQALEAFTVTEDDVGRARALRGLGRVHHARSQHVEAEESYTQALEIFVAIRDDFGRADVLFRLGNIHQARSNYAEAEESYARALERFAIIGNDLGQANTLLGLGSIQKAQSKYSEAETSYARALERFTGVGDDPGRADALFKLGNIHQARSKYAEAGDSYSQALEICTSIGDDHGRANALFKLGETHRARSNYPEAETSYTEALEIFTIIGNDVGRANSSLKLGKIRLRQGRFDEAKTLINGAAEISGRVDYQWGKRRSKSLLLSVAQAERPPT